MLKKGAVLGLLLCTGLSVYAAQSQMLWGNVDHYASLLNHFTFTQASTQKRIVNTFEVARMNVDYANRRHIRYNQYYQGLPVWHSQMIYHISSSQPTMVTGSLIDGIAQDVPTIQPTLSLSQIEKIAVGNHVISTPIKAEKIIYFDPKTSIKAILAYHISYLMKQSNGPSLQSYIIDANTGKILQQWNALPTETGQGQGGVMIDRLPYRTSWYAFSSKPLDNEFGPFDVTYHSNNNTCSTANKLFWVVNLQNQSVHQLPFPLPVSMQNEVTYGLSAFRYVCWSPWLQNNNDNGFAPVNDGVSPINDVLYFTKESINMWVNQYKVQSPVGTQLPFRIYTHIAEYDNAFACGPDCMSDSGIDGPQQLAFGNGATQFSPLTEGDLVAHELGHLLTEQFSKLEYSRQSGGINEAFSDMTAIAFNDYLRTTLGFNWYWDGKDWNIGTSVSKEGKPLRYINDPRLDGHSIDDARDFTPNMDVHYSSGIYNKAFYLLSTTPGWSIAKAYQVMLDANLYYWTPNTDFNEGACEIFLAATNRGYSYLDVDAAFKKVGVDCKKHI